MLLPLPHYLHRWQCAHSYDCLGQTLPGSRTHVPCTWGHSFPVSPGCGQTFEAVWVSTNFRPTSPDPPPPGRARPSPGLEWSQQMVLSSDSFPKPTACFWFLGAGLAVAGDIRCVNGQEGKINSWMNIVWETWKKRQSEDNNRDTASGGRTINWRWSSVRWLSFGDFCPCQLLVRCLSPAATLSSAKQKY